MDITSKVRLNNGVEMPILGFGTFKLKNGGEVETAVKTALQHGYRKIDTASAYHNEEGIGRGIIESGVPREEIFITSKVSNDEQGYKSTIDAFYQTLENLQTSYLDLYLIHWPKGKVSLETWKALEKLYEIGFIRALGVSNFQIYHLDYLLPECKIWPAVNQVEFHPEFLRPSLQEYCIDKNIQIEAWSPTMRGHVAKIIEIKEIAKKYGKTPQQIVLRWNIQNRIATNPKSSKSKRIISNADIFDFNLSDEDMERINLLEKNKPLKPYEERLKYLVEMISRPRVDKTLITMLLQGILNRIKKELYLPMVEEKEDQELEVVKD